VRYVEASLFEEKGIIQKEMKYEMKPFTLEYTHIIAFLLKPLPLSSPHPPRDAASILSLTFFSSLFLV
jgi:hypothetical protein